LPLLICFIVISCDFKGEEAGAAALEKRHINLKNFIKNEPDDI
jgi:hypothetical protein